MSTALLEPRAIPALAPPGKHSVLRTIWSILAVAFGWLPITLRGAILLAGLGAAAWFIGLERQDVILKNAAVIVAGWMAISAVLVLVAGLWLQVRPERTPDEPLRLDTLTPTSSGYSPSVVTLLPVLQFDTAWKEPQGIEAAAKLRGVRLVEEVVASQRGVFPSVRRHIRVSDLFGLVRVVVRRRWDREVRVVPAGGSAGAIPAPRSYREGEGEPCPEGGPHGDRVDQRRYTPGDPLKVVLWKAFAKSGRMLVRTPERALEEVDRLRIYFVASDDAGSDEPTAGVARAALESGAMGREFQFAADGDAATADTVDEAVKRIVASGSAHGRGGEGLARFLAEESDLSGAILFLPARPGAWFANVERAVRAQPALYRAIIGVDGIPTRRTSRGLGRLLARKNTGVTRDELRDTCSRLETLGVEPVIIDRTTGRVVERN